MTITAGKDANFDGTKVTAGGDASVKADDASQDASSKAGSMGLEGGFGATHEGASLNQAPASQLLRAGKPR